MYIVYIIDCLFKNEKSVRFSCGKKLAQNSTNVRCFGIFLVFDEKK